MDERNVHIERSINKTLYQEVLWKMHGSVIS